MTTIYTFNSKVLKNTVNDKWLIKKAAPLDEVQIGNQIWKNKNLAIDDGQGGIYTHTVNYGQGDVVEYYYTWDAAVRVAASIPGWHIPTRNDWYITLASAVGGTSNAGAKLKSTYGWDESGNGTDDFSFAVFPASNYNSNIGRYAYFWMDWNASTDYAYYITFAYNSTSMSYSNWRKSNGISVRLIKD